ncbi:MAG: polysaccharide export protein [Elusimicrobiaceae bacterium]|nr:polysaccharide export protein [Elusimicrobiaceae bacterium]
MLRKINVILIALLALIITSACNTKANVKNKVVNSSAQDIADELASLKESSDYLLHSGDLVELQVYKEEDMDRTLRISSQGTIAFPLIGNIKIAGLNISQAENKVEEELKSYLKNPSVSILIKEYANKTLYVLGQVKKPSSISIPPEKNMTLLEAITSAGGFTDIAAVSRVKILRMENGTQRSIEVDVSQITKEGNKQLDIALKPGDVVFVPQSLF